MDFKIHLSSPKGDLILTEDEAKELYATLGRIFAPPLPYPSYPAIPGVVDPKPWAPWPGFRPGDVWCGPPL